MSKFWKLGLVFLLAGCTTWEKPGASDYELENTKARCHSISYNQFPPVLSQQVVGSGYYTPMYTRCNRFGYRLYCNTYGGQYITPTIVTVDYNESARDNAFRSCMFANGWYIK